MGKNSYKLLSRREKIKTYLVVVGTSSYSKMCQEFGISPKTLTEDLAYIQDELGLVLETKSGPGGYVRVSREWYNRKGHLLPRHEDFLVYMYEKEENSQNKRALEDILINYVNPAKYLDKLKNNKS